MTKRKISKPNTDEESQTKSWKIYRDMFSFRLQPISEPAIEKIALEYVQWIFDNESVICAEEYMVYRKINISTFYTWLDKFPLLKEAHENVKSILALRRQKGAVVRDRDGLRKSYIPCVPLTDKALIMMHHYDDAWAKGEVRAARLKAQLGDADQAVNVLLLDLGQTNEVTKQIEAKKLLEMKRNVRNDQET